MSVGNGGETGPAAASLSFGELVPYEAAKLGFLIADESTWVERRVESVSFISETKHRRHTSVHFDVPGFPQRPGTAPSATLVWVPIALLKKDVLRNLDVRDEEGRALPVLSARQHAELVSRFLIQQAEVILDLPPDKLDPRIVQWLGAAIGDESAAPAPPDPDVAAQVNQLRANETITSYLRDLSRNFMLLARVDAWAHSTRIVKFAYDFDLDAEPIRRTGMIALLRAIAIPLGLSDYRTRFATPSMFDAKSYHVEVVCPEELSITEAVLSWESAHHERHDLATDFRVDRAHLYSTEPQPGEEWLGFVDTRFCLKTPVVLPVVLLTAVTAGVIGGGLWIHYVEPLGDRTDTAAALVVAIPTFFAPFVVPGRHPIAQRMFVGLRALAFLAGATSFIAAATLAVRLSTHSLEVIWGALAALAAALAAVAAGALFHSWWRTRPSDIRSRGFLHFAVVATATATLLDALHDHRVLGAGVRDAIRAASYAFVAAAILSVILKLLHDAE